MSHLLEALGKGLLTDLAQAFTTHWPPDETDDLETLLARHKRSPRSSDLGVRLGVAALRAARLRIAQDAFAAAARVQPAATLPLLGLACVADARGTLATALDHLRQAQARDGQDPATTFAVGFCLERMELPGPAGLAYRQARVLCPQLRNAYERAAALAIRSRDWRVAIHEYEQLHDLEPSDLDILLTLGTLYLQAGRFPEAIERFQDALFIEPESVPEDDLGIDNQDENALEEAIGSVERLVHKYPGVGSFHVHLGDLYVKAGEDQRAVQQYETALATQPQFLEALVKLGTHHMRRGRHVDAAMAFNRAIELNDQLISAFAGLGVAQHADGRGAEALATLDLAASLEPSTTLLYAEAARLHVQADAARRAHTVPNAGAGLEQALERHLAALRRHAGDADLRYRYGLLLRQLGQRDEACCAFADAAALQPGFAKARIKLAIALKEKGDSDRAVEVLRQAFYVPEARVLELHYRLALLFVQRARFDRTLDVFSETDAGQDSATAFRANLALALQNAGLVDRASATWRALSEMDTPAIDVLARRSQILDALQGTGADDDESFSL